MYSFQLQTLVATQLDEIIQKNGPIGRLKSGSDIRFELNSAISEVQNTQKGAFNFDRDDIAAMIAFNTTKINNTIDRDDIAVLKAMNGVLKQISTPMPGKNSPSAALNSLSW